MRLLAIIALGAATLSCGSTPRSVFVPRDVREARCFNGVTLQMTECNNRQRDNVCRYLQELNDRNCSLMALPDPTPWCKDRTPDERGGLCFP
jgi:hypothetical protein